jgi:glycosyltransferase involved in cell wall biosynthesis
VRIRVAVITEIIAPYRIPEFNALSDQPDIDLKVIFLAETDPTQRQWHILRDEMRFSFQVLPSWRRRLLGYNFLLNWGMKATLKKFRPDVIVCGGYNYFASWRALAWARRWKIPFLLWVESNAMDHRSGNVWVEKLKRAFLCRCMGFVVAGRASRSYLSSYGIPEEKIFEAPNAVDNSFFVKAAEEAKSGTRRSELGVPDRYFLFAGRLIRKKGVFDLLQAYQSLNEEIRSKVGLIFAGDGPERKMLETQASRIYPGTVKIVGFAQRLELAAYYGRADALIFPTHSDAWGLVVNEAMACGLPVIATDVAGCVADLVESGVNGFVVKVSDITALTQAMATLSENLMLRQTMGEASTRRIRGFSPAIWAEGLKRSIVANHKAGNL